MSKHCKTTLANEQKEVIAEQLAGFFFDVWQKRGRFGTESNKAIVLQSGFIEDLPRETRQ